jgi:Asp-tRNA(Asn)/Glu-tRNA(Gln) amidotransferase C subunit
LDVLADMVDALCDTFSNKATEKAEESCANLKAELEGYREFSEKPTKSTTGDIDVIAQWMERLENVETDLIRVIFSTLGNEAIELIHKACRQEGEKWGKDARERKVEVSHDARKALLVLNDYLIDGMPEEDNIEIKSSEAGQITYLRHHCNFAKRFGDSQLLAWALCSSRQAWTDGFFDAFGGVAHQNVSGKCRGDDNCMHIITLTSG